MVEEVRRYLRLPKIQGLDDQVNPLQRLRLSTIYRMRRSLNNRDFTLMFGPPFTSGIPHLGTVYSEIVKDVISSSFHSIGYRSNLRPGFDCHGLPTENMVEAKYGRFDSSSRLFDTCLREVRLNVTKQIMAYQRFHIVADWKRPYITCSEEYVSSVLKNLKALVRARKVYWGNKEVNFCIGSNFLVPLSEIDHVRSIVPRLFVRFRVAGSASLFLVIFTTTPWSLPANRAVAVSLDIGYHIYIGFRDSLIASQSCEDVLVGLGYRKSRPMDTKSLLGLSYINPLDLSKRNILTAEWVKDEGSGLVHIAGRYDIRDYRLSVRHRIEIVDLHGRDGYIFGDIKGKNIEDINSTLIKRLGHHVLHIENEEKEVAYFSRSGLQTIKVVSRQMFLDTSSARSRALTLSMINRIYWGENFKAYISGLVLRNSQDWCLTRNRVFNTPLILDGRAVTNSLRSRESGRYYGLDVWFDSANSFLFCYDKTVDIAIEGVDQYKGYFLRSIQLHAILRKHPPMKRVISTGFVVDERGEKLSKSKGNYISVNDILSRFGPEAIRIWTMKYPFFKDVTLSENQLSYALKEKDKISNYLNFMFGYWKMIEGGTPIPNVLLNAQDKWILHHLSILWVSYIRDTLLFKPQRVLSRVINFMELLSKHYLNNVKTILYLRDESSIQSTLKTFRHLTRNLLVMLRPFVPLTVGRYVSRFMKSDTFALKVNIEGSFVNRSEFDLYETALRTYIQTRPIFERKVARGSLKRPIDSVLFLNNRLKRILIPLRFFSGWKVELYGGMGKFSVLDLSLYCPLCKENRVNRGEPSCGECSSYLTEIR